MLFEDVSDRFSSHHVAKVEQRTPDRGVQEAILLVFRKFFELGAIRQALLWFLAEGLRLPVHKPTGETC